MENNDKQEITLAQWQTCVEMANSVSQRRDVMNNVFVTLNLAIIAAVSIGWDLKSIMVLAAGIVTCIIWLFFIRNFKLLNKAKFDVINQLEEKLPDKPFKEEWELLKKNKKYNDGTKLEKVVPITFIILYAIAIIIIILLNL